MPCSRSRRRLRQSDLAGVAEELRRARIEVQPALAALPETWWEAGLIENRLDGVEPAVASSLLRTEFRAVQGQALEAGLPASVIDAAATPLAPPGPPSATGDGVTDMATLAELERAVVEATATTRSIRTLTVAARHTLEQLGLNVTLTEDDDGGSVVSGVHPDGRIADVTVSGESIEVFTYDPASAVHPLDPTALETCRPAAELAAAVHTGLEAAYAEAGVLAGEIEQLGHSHGPRTPPRKSAQRAAARRVRRASL